MLTLSCETDSLFENQTASLNSSSEDLQVLDAVKACVHTVSFISTGVFTFLITMTVMGSRLYKNPWYLLLCQHCVCISGFNVLGSILHSLRFFHWPTKRLTYWILLDLQVVMTHCLTITLTLMCMCVCLSIVKPLHYPVLVHCYFPWMILLSWLLALVNPVVFTILACIQQPWDYVTGLNTDGATPLESKACVISIVLLLGLMVLLVFGSYLLICFKGCRAGHLTWSCKACCTILIHILQMILYIFPAIILITGFHHSLAVALTTFLVLTIAQCFSPVFYGLRYKALQEELPRFLPQCLRNRVVVELYSPNTGPTTNTGRTASTDLSTTVLISTSIWHANITLPGTVEEAKIRPGTERDQEDAAQLPSLET